MDNNINDIEAHPEKRGDEDLPLIPMSPALNRNQRAKALSQLSLHSEGSLLFDATFDGKDAELLVCLKNLNISMKVIAYYQSMLETEFRAFEVTGLHFKNAKFSRSDLARAVSLLHELTHD